MNLMTMQFGSFVFPVNPTELKLERACLLRETVGVDGEERVEAVGKRKARVAGARRSSPGRMRWRFTAS